MSVYIALLRGINVSGHRIIKMAELRAMFEQMGMQRVQTYIQSGNIIFASPEANEEPSALRKRVEAEIEKTFGFPVNVMLRTAEQFQAILAHCPYDAAALSEGEGIQVSMLADDAPSPEQIARVLDPGNEKDEYAIIGQELYVLLRQRVLDSKLATNMQKLGQAVTTRNWNTMTKLNTMAQAAVAQA